MPTVGGEKFAYTPAGMQAAAKAKRAKVQGSAPQPAPKPPQPKPNPDAVKTKGDMMANVMPSAKNLGY